MRTAEVIAHGRNNNFNLIRMIAASCVIVSHSFPLALGHGAIEPLHFLAPLDLGKASVRVFFAISGFFIMKSFDHRSSLWGFAGARFARIVPGLLVISAGATVLSWLGITFANNPWPNTVNGSLWTLWFEATCYVVLALAGICGLYSNGRFPAFLIAFGLVWSAIQLGILSVDIAYATLSVSFVVGMAVYHWRSIIVLDGRIATVFLIAAAIQPSDATWSFALGYTALWAGASFPALHGYNRLGDYSYGTYIFGWPVQQLIIRAIPGISPLQLMSLALPLVWCLGTISWHFVEHPVLSFAQRQRKGPRTPHQWHTAPQP